MVGKKLNQRVLSLAKQFSACSPLNTFPGLERNVQQLFTDLMPSAMLGRSAFSTSTARVPFAAHSPRNMFTAAAPLTSLRELALRHASPNGFQQPGLASMSPYPGWQPRSFSSTPPWRQKVHHTQKGALSDSFEELLEPPPVEEDYGSQKPRYSAAAKQARELHAVDTAVAVNLAIFVAKVGTWWMTRSGALLAEALHSLADIVNQLLLRAGVNQSRRAPTRQHPYGFHREKYIYALMSAVGVFCVGAGASVVHGIQALMDPPALEHMGYSLAVLGISSVAELYSLNVALGALRIGAEEQDQPLMRYLMSSRDPTTAAVLAEDAGAVAGLGIAGVASYLTWTTGNPVYDAVGSICVGVLMGGVAVMLIRNNKRFLIGQAMQPDKHAAILAHLRADPMILAVVDPKSEQVGDGVYRFKAEIQWSGDRIVNKYLSKLGRESLYKQIRDAACSAPGVTEETLRCAIDLSMMEFGRGVIHTVGGEIDRLEVELRALCPGLQYVDLETDRGRMDQSSLECRISEGDESESSGQQSSGPAMGAAAA